MSGERFGLTLRVHRHTGGLEIASIAILKRPQVHRHTGGLEIPDTAYA